MGDRRERRGKHAAYVVRGRDFTPDGEIGAVEIRDGDRCARCGSPLEIARGIELGHVFQLGRKYAETFGLTALGQDGKPVTVTMGSYGVGITRAVAALAEQTYDEKGLCWPRSVAPADVHMVPTGKDDAVFAAAERLAGELEAAGVRVLLDDRQGLAGGEVQGRRAARRADDPDRGHAAWPTAWWSCATAVPTSGATSRSTHAAEA